MRFLNWIVLYDCFITKKMIMTSLIKLIWNLHSQRALTFRQFRYPSCKLTCQTLFVSYYTAWMGNELDFAALWTRYHATDSRITAQRDDTRGSNPKVRDLWLRNGHVRERISNNGGSGDLWPPAGSRTLSRVQRNGYKRHTMLPWTRTMGHPLVPGGIVHSREKKS